MKFHLFRRRLDAHIRRAQDYLDEANLARIEHQVAAEHHAALAKMYSERAARLEEEISRALQPRSMSARLRGEEFEEAGERVAVEAALYSVPAARAAHP